MSNLSDFLYISDFIPIELLVVGGGGGGGHSNLPDKYTAGGGAGQVIFGNINALTNITYNITVGTGGAGMTFASSSSGSEGQPSFFGSLKAYGGGRGAYAAEDAPIPTNEPFFAGSLGGSGNVSAPSIPFPRFNSAEYVSLANIGGTTFSPTSVGATGGGAGGPGVQTTTTSTPTNGIDLDITGTTETYAHGGAVNRSANNTAPTVYGQGGKGGRTSGFTTDAQAGGGGVVIIAYPDTYPAPLVITGTPDELTTRPGYRVYRWTTGTGTVKF